MLISGSCSFQGHAHFRVSLILYHYNFVATGTGYQTKQLAFSKLYLSNRYWGRNDWNKNFKLKILLYIIFLHFFLLWIFASTKQHDWLHKQQHNYVLACQYHPHCLVDAGNGCCMLMSPPEKYQRQMRSWVPLDQLWHFLTMFPFWQSNPAHCYWCKQDSKLKIKSKVHFKFNTKA